eukprot:scaffold16_cov190-Alexandrium_tamarense.AAC.11
MGVEAEESRERLIRDVDVWTPRLPNRTRAAPGALHSSIESPPQPTSSTEEQVLATPLSVRRSLGFPCGRNALPPLSLLHQLTMMLPLLLVAATLLVGSNGFIAPPSSRAAHLASRHISAPTSTTTSLNILPESIAAGGPDAARGYFFIWFFGGSGGGGVALRQIPQQYAKFRSLTEMKDDGPSAGGETVGLSPLCLYPRDLCQADLKKVLNNKLSVEKMVEVGPKPNYLSERGYLCYESFVAANKGCNPLTVRAVFDAMSTGDNVDPELAQSKLDLFRNDNSSDLSAFKNELLNTKLTGYSSIAFLLFLLGPIVGSTCLAALAAGWFPEWPGIDNLPYSLLFGPGFWTIPGYWI